MAEGSGLSRILVYSLEVNFLASTRAKKEDVGCYQVMVFVCQVVALLRQVDSSDRETELLITSLEALAKLAWNDDEVSATETVHVFGSQPGCKCFRGGLHVTTGYLWAL